MHLRNLSRTCRLWLLLVFFPLSPPSARLEGHHGEVFQLSNPSRVWLRRVFPRKNFAAFVEKCEREVSLDLKCKSGLELWFNFDTEKALVTANTRKKKLLARLSKACEPNNIAKSNALHLYSFHDERFPPFMAVSWTINYFERRGNKCLEQSGFLQG